MPFLFLRAVRVRTHKHAPLHAYPVQNRRQPEKERQEKTASILVFFQYHRVSVFTLSSLRATEAEMGVEKKRKRLQV